MQTAAPLHPLPHAPLPHPVHHRSNSLTRDPHRRKPTVPAPELWEDRGHKQTWILNQGFSASSPTVNLAHFVKAKSPSQHRSKRSPGWMTEEWVGQQAMYYVPVEDNAPISRHHHDGHGRHRSGSLPRRDGPPPPTQPPLPGSTPRRGAHWEDMMYQYEVDTERWMRREAESRRLAEERYRTQAKIEEDIRRLEEQMRQRKIEHRRILEENRARMYFGMPLRPVPQNPQERKRLETGVVEAWEKYESRWAEIGSSTEELKFDTMPWPTVVPPKSVDDLTLSTVASFLLSGLHSQQTSKKDRLRSAQLRWHPDRFRRLINRVVEEDKEKVEKGVGAVARVLNDLMEREKGNSK